MIYKYKQLKIVKDRLVNLISTDENIQELLEASEAPIAKELVPITKKLLLGSGEPSMPPWYHCSSAVTPAESAWNLFLEDMELETTEEDKLKCLKVWARKSSFTFFEDVRISELFSDPRCRKIARNIITPKKEKTEK